MTKLIFEKSQESKHQLYIPFEVNLIYQPRFDLNELHRRPEFALAVKTVTPPNLPPEDPIANTTLADQPGK
jgi:hypothetical protein